MTLVDLPTYTDFLDPRLVVEASGGTQHPKMYTDRFPDSVYHKAPESHLIRFLYALLGPSGVGYIGTLTQQARLELESVGLELFNLESFYGDPFGFGRITEEYYDEDVTGLLNKDEWDAIKLKDSSYQNRAIKYMNAAKAGNTPLGMQLASESALGYPTEIIENYQYLYDIHSDDPIGLNYYGITASLQEMVVLPHRDTSRSEVQTIIITGEPTGGTFVIYFNGDVTVPLPYNCNMYDVQNALWDLSSVGANNVIVRGRPAPLNTFEVTFAGTLSNRDVPEMTITHSFTGGINPDAEVITNVGGVDASNEVINIPSASAHYLQTALDKLRPVGTIPTLYDSEGNRKQVPWSSALASSSHYSVLRYVTGNPAVYWLPVDNVNWIQRNVEKEAPRAHNSDPYHYQGYHNVKSIMSYTDLSYSDNVEEIITDANHIGQFTPPQTTTFPFQFLNDINDDVLVFTPDRALADYFEPLVVDGFPLENSLNTLGTTNPTQLINGIYPTSWTSLPYVPEIKYKDEQFWASLERTEGADYLEIDLGQPVPVNFIAFEITRKPVDIEVTIDSLDQYPYRNFIPINVTDDSDLAVHYNPNENSPWYAANIFFNNDQQRIPITRHIRIKLSRRVDDTPFLVTNNVPAPWSIEIRNMRIGRNVSTF